MRQVGLMLNLRKPQAVEVGRDLYQWLRKRQIEVLMPIANARAIHCSAGTSEAKVVSQAEVLIILGGDGTLLNGARSAAPFGTPVLGINLGGLGFLTELEPSDLYHGLELLLAGQYTIDERMMLKATVIRQDVEIEHVYALNDAVIAKGAFSRMIRLETQVRGSSIATYPADGLIIATPTGSTAYSLSAGGPVVSPEMRAIIITPICPHTLYSRPLIVSSSEKIVVLLRSEAAEVMLTVDGQRGIKLEASDKIIVEEAEFRAKLVRIKGRGFFEVLQQKLQDNHGVMPWPEE
ncbi:MAG: NAD(+)/NADH kinase [Clostridia bacterium]|nr:NAD(+)/NADH kinase [Clostridia bacterium]